MRGRDIDPLDVNQLCHEARFATPTGNGSPVDDTGHHGVDARADFSHPSIRRHPDSPACRSRPRSETTAGCRFGTVTQRGAWLTPRSRGTVSTGTDVSTGLHRTDVDWISTQSHGCDAPAPLSQRAAAVGSKRHHDLVLGSDDRRTGNAGSTRTGGIRTGAARAPRRSRLATRIVIGLSVLAAVAGIALLVVGILAFNQADDTRAQTAKLHTQRRAIEARTARAERDVDAPINDAERVAKSVTTIVEASASVITQSTETNSVLDRAVQLANNGRRAESSQLLAGEGASSVQRLNSTLARAQDALAAAQLAAANLAAGNR